MPANAQIIKQNPVLDYQKYLHGESSKFLLRSYYNLFVYLSVYSIYLEEGEVLAGVLLPAADASESAPDEGGHPQL